MSPEIGEDVVNVGKGEISVSVAGVKGRLHKCIDFWRDELCAPPWILSVITQGYILPFMSAPPPYSRPNQPSAFAESEFVDSAIAELLLGGCIKMVAEQPVVCSPLSVVVNGAGKRRLVVNLRHVNHYLKVQKFKYEDLRVAMLLFKPGEWMFAFDLKSGYHHVDIVEHHQKFLGFRWKAGFYVFTVLPFGLCTALQDVAKKWLKGCTTMEERLDAIVKEQLVDTLPQALKIWVSEREPSSSKEAGELADSYLQTRGLERGGARRGEYGERSHTDREHQYPRGERVGEAEFAEKNPKRAGNLGYQRKQEVNGGKGPSNLRCYNCSKTGHFSRDCPENALFSRSRENCRFGKSERPADRAVLRSGFVEGNKVQDIVLDTGCSRTMIRSDLVPMTKLLDDAVMVQCAHGDMVAYPLAVVELTVDGLPLTVEVALSDTLPTAVLLGRDVPELSQLLGERKARELHDTTGRDEAMMVTTRYGASKRRELEEQLQEQEGQVETEQLCQDEAEAETQAQHYTERSEQAVELQVQNDTETLTESQDGMQEQARESEPETTGVLPEDPWRDALDDELLEGGRTRRRLTRAQKRQERKNCWQKEGGAGGKPVLDFGAAEVHELQNTDESLAEIRQSLKDGHPEDVEGKD